MEEVGEFSVFLHCHLGPDSYLLWYLPIVEHLGCTQFGGITNEATIDDHVQIFE